MKKVPQRLSHVVLVMLFVLTVSLSYAQKTFKDGNLALMENIAFNAKSESLGKFMKKLDYTQYNESLYDDEAWYSFISNYGTKSMIWYRPLNKVSALSVAIKAEDIAYLVEQLEENNFIKTGTESNFKWRNEKYPFYFSFTEPDCLGSCTIIMSRAK